MEEIKKYIVENITKTSIKTDETTVTAIHKQLFQLIPRASIDTLQCNYNIIPIYFDHKVADALSTFQKFLRFGIYPINYDAECEHESIINNCEPPIDTYTYKNMCKDYLHDIPSEFVCPIPYYKTIIYEYKEYIFRLNLSLEENLKKYNNV